MAKGSGSTRASSSGNPRGLSGASSGIRSFLLGYKPANEHFTSYAEIDLISDKLNLANKNEDELNSMRNTVVSIYRDAMDKEINYDENGEFAGRTEKYWDYSTAMQSVTAAIDYIKSRRGMAV